MSRSDLAKIGSDFGDRDARIWKITLHSLSSLDVGGFASDKHIEAVAGQVYNEVKTGSEPSKAQDFVEVFIDTYDLTNKSDVNNLLGRERHEKENYSGRVGMIIDRQKPQQ